MSKQQLIEAIRERNRSASEDFLVGFDVGALNNYLSHLDYQSGPRGRDAMWVRTGETPAIVARYN